MEYKKTKRKRSLQKAIVTTGRIQVSFMNKVTYSDFLKGPEKFYESLQEVIVSNFSCETNLNPPAAAVAS